MKNNQVQVQIDGINYIFKKTNSFLLFECESSKTEKTELTTLLNLKEIIAIDISFNKDFDNNNRSSCCVKFFSTRRDVHFNFRKNYLSSKEPKKEVFEINSNSTMTFLTFIINDDKKRSDIFLQIKELAESI